MINKNDIDEALDQATPIPSDREAPGAEAPASATVHAWDKDSFGVLFTIRDTDAKSCYARMSNFLKVLKADGWKPDWNKKEEPKEDLGVCRKCGAPNLRSIKGKVYCSKKCWLVEEA